MTVCAIPECDEHYGCRLRNKGLQLSPKATPSRVSVRKFKPRPMQHNSYGHGVTGEKRRDGTFMPYIDNTGSIVRQGTMDRDRRNLTAIRDRQLAKTHAERTAPSA